MKSQAQIVNIMEEEVQQWCKDNPKVSADSNTRVERATMVVQLTHIAGIEVKLNRILAILTEGLG